MREGTVPLTAEIEDAAHQLESGHQESMEMLEPFALDHSLIPSTIERERVNGSTKPVGLESMVYSTHGFLF